MQISGIICEYNPFHLGHQKQISHLRAENPDVGIVCLMSGNFVQRGAPAIFDKAHRAKAALLCGADLVLELPVTAALSSAEGFAEAGVRILETFCDRLSFGAESNDMQNILNTAQALLSDQFSIQLKQALTSGCSFPSARQKALEKMGLDASILETPNNILAVEYCKAILSRNSKMKPDVIKREGDYHDSSLNAQNPSATALRMQIESGKEWRMYVPEAAFKCFECAEIHHIAYAEQAILYRLRTMTDAEFEALPYGSEGLWRKLMKNARQYATLEEILDATKSKRYTRTRLDRMVMCALLQITADDLLSPPQYSRVLALNDKGREILLKARQSGHFPNIGEKLDHPYQAIENRCDDLYGLFAKNKIDSPGLAGKRRLFYCK